MSDNDIFQFKISLKGAKPSIWRRIQISSRATFHDFHRAIRDSMGWKDTHLHEFKIKNFRVGRRRRNEVIGMPDPDSDTPITDDKSVVLASYFPRTKRTLYLYDFGDNWEHEVVLEEVWPAQTGGHYPKCVAGARTGPPEDCGGVSGYRELVKIMMDPEHPEHVERKEWMEMIEYKFHPKFFDPAAVKFLTLAEEDALRAAALAETFYAF